MNDAGAYRVSVVGKIIRRYELEIAKALLTSDLLAHDPEIWRMISNKDLKAVLQTTQCHCYKSICFALHKDEIISAAKRIMNMHHE